MAVANTPNDSPRVHGRWDLFCKVVDNFGDAAVCWRLSRQLAQEQGAQVLLTSFGRAMSLTKRIGGRLPQPAPVLELDVTDPERAQALREDDSVIEGLYAVGAATGGLEGGPKIGYVGGLAKGGITGMAAATHMAGKSG